MENEIMENEIKFQVPEMFQGDENNVIQKDNYEQRQKRIQSGLAPLGYVPRRRGSVSAESYNPAMAQSTGLTSPLTRPTLSPEHANAFICDETTRKRIEKAVMGNLLFRNLDEDQREMIFKGMSERKVKTGEVIVKQGEEGDNFYVVDRGMFSVLVDGKQIVQIGPNGSFGELALMYNTKRAATVIATEDGVLWVVDRVTFRKVIIDVAYEKRKKYEKFLRAVPLLKTLNDQEIHRVVDALKPLTFAPNQTVLVQNEPGDSFYIIVSGEAVVLRDGVEINRLSTGDYFGELALINGGPRFATVVATEATPLKCITLKAGDFVRLLGPVMDILKRNQEHYEQYQQYFEQQQRNVLLNQ